MIFSSGQSPSENIITEGNIKPNPPRSWSINDKYFINECECFTRVSKHARTIEFTRLFTKRFLLFSRICKTRKTMKTRGRNGRVVFIVLSVLQLQENNEYRLVNGLVNSIVLACLETPVKHSHSFMKYYIKHYTLYNKEHLYISFYIGLKNLSKIMHPH